jgi:hypothetical protein
MDLFKGRRQEKRSMTARHFPPPWTSKVNAMITKELGAGMREVVIIAIAGVQVVALLVYFLW